MEKGNYVQDGCAELDTGVGGIGQGVVPTPKESLTACAFCSLMCTEAVRGGNGPLTSMHLRE
jgi:hypothetical protein